MKLYRDEINMMNDIELLELVAIKVLKLDTDNIDVDEIIEALEQQDGEIFECKEHDVLDSIYFGNWSQAVEQMMQSPYMFPSQIADYVEDQRIELYEEAFEFFNLSSMSALCDLFYTARENQRKAT